MLRLNIASCIQMIFVTIKALRIYKKKNSIAKELYTFTVNCFLPKYFPYLSVSMQKEMYSTVLMDGGEKNNLGRSL